MTLRKIMAIGSMIAAIMVNLPANSQTLRERMLERRAARQHEMNSTFPPKGDLRQARTVWLTSDGVRRSYLIAVPEGLRPLPVVVLLHGGTEDAEQVWRQTSLPTLPLREGFIIVAPNALNKHWNDSRGAVLGGAPSTADDVGFLKKVIADVVAKDGGNPKAVFMVGASNGGFMTMHFACQAPGVLRAASYVVSDLPVAEESQCAASPMPWLAMNGTADPIVPFDGMKAGTVKNGAPQPELRSAEATFDFWAARDHCGDFVSKDTLPHLNPDDPTSAERRICKGDDGLPSIEYVFQGGGHSWPNRQYGPLIRQVIGDSNQDVDAGQAILGFFKGTL
jgi:polyhydroxybutyrate depolymerase